MHVIKNNCKWYFKYLRGIATSRELITAYKIKTRMARPYKEVDVHIPRIRSYAVVVLFAYDIRLELGRPRHP